MLADFYIPRQILYRIPDHFKKRVFYIPARFCYVQDKMCNFTRNHFFIKILFFRENMSKKGVPSYDDFLLAFGQANKFVFHSSSGMQKAAMSMWKDIKNKPDELNLFIKEVKY